MGQMLVHKNVTLYTVTFGEKALALAMSRSSKVCGYSIQFLPANHLNDLTFLFQVCSPGMKRHAMSTLEENWRSLHLWHLLEKNVGVVCIFLLGI